MCFTQTGNCLNMVNSFCTTIGSNCSDYLRQYVGIIDCTHTHNCDISHLLWRDILKPALHLVPPSCPFMEQHQGGHFEKHTAHHYSKTQKAPSSTMWVSWERFNFMQMSSDTQEQQPADNQTRSFWFPHEREIVVLYSTPLCPHEAKICPDIKMFLDSSMWLFQKWMEKKYITEHTLSFAVSLTLTCADVY